MSFGKVYFQTKYSKNFQDMIEHEFLVQGNIPGTKFWDTSYLLVVGYLHLSAKSHQHNKFSAGTH